MRGPTGIENRPSVTGPSIFHSTPSPPKSAV